MVKKNDQWREKMKIAEISTFADYSVGKIMRDISSFINDSTNDECKIFYGRNKSDKGNSIYYFGNFFNVLFNAFFARIFDNDGFCHSHLTKRLIKSLKEYDPDVIHLHCLHGYVFNIKELFEFARKSHIKIVWTMHDTWAFTGHCCYFGMAKCKKRQKYCNKCPQKKSYPKAFFSNSKRNFFKKQKQILQFDEDMLTIVSPSFWMDNLIGISFLKKYNHLVIHNGINTDFFNCSLKKNNNKNTKILLGVANVWDERKGLDFFIKLSNLIDNSWKIVLVGKIPNNVKFSENIKHIERTENQSALRDLYYSASIFFNPTLDENYPTVNLEAQLCGCKVLTFDTGGSIETNCGNLYTTGKSMNEILSKINSLSSKPLHAINVKYASYLTMANQYYQLFLKLRKLNHEG